MYSQTQKYTRCTLDELCIRGFYTKAELAKKMNVKMETLQLYMNSGGVYPDTIRKIERVITEELAFVSARYSHIPIEYCTVTGLQRELLRLIETLSQSKLQLSNTLNVPSGYIYNCCDGKSLSPSTIKKLATALVDYYGVNQVVVS